MDINDFVAFYINLDKREDRRKEAENEFKKLPFSVNRFPAVPTIDGKVGCFLSHMGVFSVAKTVQKHAIVFEDDVKFLPDISNIMTYLMALDDMDWDMVYLGGNICGPITRVSNKFGKLSHCQSTHAYIVNKNFIEILQTYHIHIGKHLDLVYTDEIIPYHNCYITIPILAIQRESYSDIEKTTVRYEDWMERRYYSNLK
jgi:GR25 family glycosyltransferase involved in LPS biosynthesis